MERDHVSRASAAIKASSAAVWGALVCADAAKKYFFGAKLDCDWTEGSPIAFTGEFRGNAYREKGTILRCSPESLLRYSHWSDLEGLPDVPENYRTWTFRIAAEGAGVVLSVTEDNIPTEDKRARSDEFWQGVFSTIKEIVESESKA
jgi:uncharacterized protein YndB with AHSA1/START domain